MFAAYFREKGTYLRGKRARRGYVSRAPADGDMYVRARALFRINVIRNYPPTGALLRAHANRLSYPVSAADYNGIDVPPAALSLARRRLTPRAKSPGAFHHILRTRLSTHPPPPASAFYPFAFLYPRAGVRNRLRHGGTANSFDSRASFCVKPGGRRACTVCTVLQIPFVLRANYRFS